MPRNSTFDDDPQQFLLDAAKVLQVLTDAKIAIDAQTAFVLMAIGLGVCHVEGMSREDIVTFSRNANLVAKEVIQKLSLRGNK